MHHPGGKQQLEDVWEQQDHLSPDSFDPKTFFVLHGSHHYFLYCITVNYLSSLELFYKKIFY